VKLADAVKAARGLKIHHAKRFAQHVVPEVVRPARVIWNQAIGGIFLLFAVSFIGYAVVQANKNLAAMGMGLFLGAVMGFFCITSFLKARRISQRR
jgi:ABC-type dipeptide/oligopeptide/nickel transport system permease subunit